MASDPCQCGQCSTQICSCLRDAVQLVVLPIFEYNLAAHIVWGHFHQEEYIDDANVQQEVVDVFPIIA